MYSRNRKRGLFCWRVSPLQASNETKRRYARVARSIEPKKEKLKEAEESYESEVMSGILLGCFFEDHFWGGLGEWKSSYCQIFIYCSCLLIILLLVVWNIAGSSLQDANQAAESKLMAKKKELKAVQDNVTWFFLDVRRWVKTCQNLTFCCGYLMLFDVI